MTLAISGEDPELLDTGGCTYRVLADGSATGGRQAVLEGHLSPGWGGPPQHVHRGFDETFYVVAGAVRFTSGTESVVLGPGRLVTAPLSTPHTFANQSASEPALVLITLAPERYLGYFREVSRLPLGPDGRPDDAAVVEIMARHDTERWSSAG
jgi:mannose-6-phosphate isomerase-like protein (cupin superfamily)